MVREADETNMDIQDSWTDKIREALGAPKLHRAGDTLGDSWHPSSAAGRQWRETSGDERRSLRVEGQLDPVSDDQLRLRLCLEHLEGRATRGRAGSRFVFQIARQLLLLLLLYSRYRS